MICYVEIISRFGGYDLCLSDRNGCSYSVFQIIFFIVYALFFVVMIASCFCACCFVKKMSKKSDNSSSSTRSGNMSNTQNGNYTYFPSSGNGNPNDDHYYPNSYSGNSVSVPILQQQYPLFVCFDYFI